MGPMVVVAQVFPWRDFVLQAKWRIFQRDKKRHNMDCLIEIIHLKISRDHSLFFALIAVALH